jgi:hypothetical protein
MVENGRLIRYRRRSKGNVDLKAWRVNTTSYSLRIGFIIYYFLLGTYPRAKNVVVGRRRPGCYFIGSYFDNIVLDVDYRH